MKWRLAILHLINLKSIATFVYKILSEDLRQEEE